MESYVLFSPIGNTDPIGFNGYDGPMLNIVRYRRPKKAVLFYTKLICDREQHDKETMSEDRYGMLVHRVCPGCEVERIRHKEIDNPADFDNFYPLFEEILSDIKRKYPKYTILVNVSSGTPQMEQALELICAMSESGYKAVQVTSPPEKEKKKALDYNLKELWGKNTICSGKENEPDIRCKGVAAPYQLRLFSRFNCRKLIDNFDYSGAKELLKTVDKEPDIGHLLEIAQNRVELKTDEAVRLAEQYGFSDVFPIKEQKPRICYEYILWMQIKQVHGEMLDFTRAVSPILTELSCEYLLNIHHFNIQNELCDKSKKNDLTLYKLKRSKVQKFPDLLDAYDSFFAKTSGDISNKLKPYSALSYNNIVPVIIYFCKQNSKTDILNKIEILRNFEQMARNIVAHNIMGLDDKKLKTLYGYESGDILEALKFVFIRTYPQYSDPDWDSYLTLNRRLKEMLFK